MLDVPESKEFTRAEVEVMKKKIEELNAVANPEFAKPVVAEKAQMRIDHGDLTALRYGDWKLIFMEQKVEETLLIWQEPFVELRFPLLERMGLDLPFGTMNFGLLRGALFFDAGNTWDPRYYETLGSVGGGIRFSMFGMLVLRYDIGKRIENNFTTIQRGVYHQFWFGWDF